MDKNNIFILKITVLNTIEYTITAIVCLISAIVIQRIFIKERQKSIDSENVQGIKWFGLAIFTWGLGALGNLFFTDFIVVKSEIIIYWSLVISLANSLFILLSLPSIEHAKSRSMGVQLVERFTTREFIMLFSGVLGMIIFVFVVSSYSNNNLSNNFTWVIDIPISVFVALSLLFELNKAFTSRQMKFMLLPTLALFILILIAVSHRIVPQDQVVQFIDQDFWAVVGTITSISFKFLFILLFSILLYSWKFLSEKEQQQNIATVLLNEKDELYKKSEQLEIANESHLNTIKALREKVSSLEQAHTIILSDRQKEVLGNLAAGGSKKSYPQLAEEMNISVDGLQTHIHQIKQILNIKGAGGKEQLIAYAIDNNMTKHASLKSRI